MAALRISTPTITLPDLLRRLLPVARPDLFDLEDCDDSGAAAHLVDRDKDAGNNVAALEQEAI